VRQKARLLTFDGTLFDGMSLDTSSSGKLTGCQSCINRCRQTKVFAGERSTDEAVLIEPSVPRIIAQMNRIDEGATQVGVSRFLWFGSLGDRIQTPHTLH
jgi:hypothetical protein